MSDAAELEREAEAARARLSDTADQLRARMSPGQMMDEVLNHFRDGDGNAMLSNLRTQARDNPMALALVGSGLAWLMLGSGGGGSSLPAGSGYGTPSVPKPHEPPLPGSGFGEAPSRLGSWSPDEGEGSAGLGERASDAVGAAREALGSAKDAVGDRLHRAGDAVGEGLHRAGDAVGEGLHRAGGKAQDLRSAGSDALAGARSQAAGLGQQAQRGFFDMLDREPLVIGALGLAVGAAIGALLPTTELERQQLGPTGEALKDKAGGLVERGVAAAKEAAAEVYQSARDEADRQGLVPGDAPIADKIGAVVRAAGESAGSVVGRAAEEEDDERPTAEEGAPNRA